MWYIAEIICMSVHDILLLHNIKFKFWGQILAVLVSHSTKRQINIHQYSTIKAKIDKDLNLKQTSIASQLNIDLLILF